MNRADREIALLDISAISKSIDRINDVSRGTSNHVVQKYASQCISELAYKLASIAAIIAFQTQENDTNG